MKRAFFAIAFAVTAAFVACQSNDEQATPQPQDAAIDAGGHRLGATTNTLKVGNLNATGLVSAHEVDQSGAQVFSAVDVGGGLVDTTPGSVGLTRACSSPAVLKWTGAGWGCASYSDGTVTVTSPITGTGSAGAPLAWSPTLGNLQGTGSAGSALRTNLTTTSCGTGSDVNAIAATGIGMCTAVVNTVTSLTGATGGLSCSTSAGAVTCWAGSATGCPAGDLAEDVTGGSAGWQCVAMPGAPSGTGYVHVTSGVYDAASNALSAVTSMTATGLVKVGGFQDTSTAVTTSGTINNWNPTGWGWGWVTVVYANITSDSDLTGLLAGVDGQHLRIINVGAGHLTVNHQNTNSLIANRLVTPTATQWIATSNAGGAATTIDFEYEATLGMWVMTGIAGNVFPAVTVIGAASVGSITSTGLVTASNGLTVTTGTITGVPGRIIGHQVLISGSSSPYVPTTGTKAVELEMVGGGGAGGSSTTGASATSAGGGGSSGAYLRTYIACGGSCAGGAFVIGAAGAVGLAGNHAGGDGGDTTIIINSITYTAKRGIGGGGMPAESGGFVVPGGGFLTGTGASSGTPDVATGQTPGGPGIAQGATQAISGNGGSSPWGTGGGGVIIGTDANGFAGNGPGAGGGGGGSSSTASKTGGAGVAGQIIVTEYQ